jgi:hypothetical protein
MNRGKSDEQLKAIHSACCFHVMQFNGCSFIANLTEIKSRVIQEQPTLIIVQEDWLDEIFSCKIPGYDWIHRARTTGRSTQSIRGGGVSILIRNDPRISFKRLYFDLGDDVTTETVYTRLFYKNPTG